MQDLSYNPNDPVFTFGSVRFSLQIFTFENVYGLRPDLCIVSGNDTTLDVTCTGLQWAGGQEHAAGSAHIRAELRDGRTVFDITASTGKTIRCVKLRLHGIDDGIIVNLRETGEQVIPAEGLLYKYPSGWRGLYTPLIVLKTGADRFVFYRSLDTQVREKRFALIRSGNQLDMELIFEDDAIRMGSRVTLPTWEVGTATDVETIYAEQLAHIERTYELPTWEKRPDVPEWARHISLIAAIHCQHYSGYIFNDYAKVLEHIRMIAGHIDPKHVLVYLPGWEGRYYWQYGDYRPDPRMGGEAGFEKLVSEAMALGVHIMPMFGLNVVNKGLEDYATWGGPAAFLSSGGRGEGGTVDWDSARHYDHGWGSLLNPGIPSWQNRLVEQIRGLAERYLFDGVFLDISAAWWNDPRAHVYSGTVDLIRRIKEGNPHMLIGGEGWFDALSAVTPLVQSGHTEGVLHWHDVPFPPLFDAHARSFAHLCLGDPGRGSTGVHELGTNPITRSPIRKGIIPTVTVVEDTMMHEGVLQIIQDAKHYAEVHLYSPVTQSSD
jgi:hypothetical protein